MDVEQRLKICRLIEAVITADGVVATEERDYLHQVMQRFRLPEYELGRDDTISVGPATGVLREFAPDVQMRVMALLVDAAVVDGRVEPEERALLLAAAASLGIDAVALEERIARRLKATVS